MARHIRRARPASDLRRELQDQVTLLAHACKSFDSGVKPIGKHIALSLRVLLHHHGKSQALLQQLGLRSNRFIDTAGDLNSKNLLTDCPLCITQVSSSGAEHLARCEVGGGPLPPRWIPFPDWWINPVIKDNKGRYFNRLELVTNVADTDGGAHVDPDLDDAYMALSRENSLGWIFTSGGISVPMGGPELPCVRQIAHEVLETLKVQAKDHVNVRYPI